MHLIKSKRGEMMITACVLLMIGMFIFAFVLKTYPVFKEGQQLNTYAAELCRVAEISGRVGDETTEKEKKLNQTMHISPQIVWSKTGKVQLNQGIDVTCSLTENIGLFGGMGSFPVTLRGHATGQSEVYWKDD